MSKALSHELLLFDLDGTISDPLVGIARSLNHALTHFGHVPLDLSAVATYIGPPLDQAFRTITGTTSQHHLEALVGKYRERYAEVGYAENALYPGVADALGRLAATGIPLAVCTSKREDFAVRILEMFGLVDHFRFVSGGDIGIEKWQQIGGLLEQGAVSKTTVMIGDRSVDLVAAHRNGLHAAGVLWGYGSRHELEAEQPRYLFGSPGELHGLVQVGRDEPL